MEGRKWRVVGGGGVWREKTRKGRGECDMCGEKADMMLPGFDFSISTSCDIPWGHFHNENNSHSNIIFSVKKYFVNQQFAMQHTYLF